MFSFVAKRVAQLKSVRLLSRTFSNADGESEEARRFEKCVNQVNLLGRAGRDAEIRGTEQHPVVVFSMATNNLYTKADGKNVSRVDWHRVSVFRPGLREKIAANIKKGDRVFVSGSIQYEDYKNENTVNRTANVIANDIVNLTKKYMDDAME